jgi:DNA-binding winged helix-turn-helix (wHTH) protein
MGKKQGLRYRLSKSKQSGKLPPFVPMIWEMLNSKVYKALSYSASKALVYFLGKPKMIVTHKEFYENVFEFTYSEANNLGFSASTWKRCIEELIEKGFVDPVWKGGLRGNGKSSSKFKNSIRWLDYETPNFKEKHWKQFVQHKPH